MPIIKNMVVAEGIDCSGKGFIIDELARIAATEGNMVFDVRQYQQENNSHPPIANLLPFMALVTAEPTFEGAGRRIRNKLILTGSDHHPLAIAEAYAESRHSLYTNIILPHRGKLILQERSVVSSMVYQPTHARSKGEKSPSLDEVIGIPGNAFCLKHPPEYLIIATLRAETAMRRLSERKKQDQCTFEKLEFQKALQKDYESDWLREFLEKKGTRVMYISTDDPNTLDDTRRAVRQFYDQYLKN